MMHNNCNNNCKTFKSCLNTIPSSFIDCETAYHSSTSYTLYLFIDCGIVCNSVRLPLCLLPPFFKREIFTPSIRLLFVLAAWVFGGFVIFEGAFFKTRSIHTPSILRLLLCVRLILSVLLCLHLGKSLWSLFLVLSSCTSSQGNNHCSFFV